MKKNKVVIQLQALSKKELKLLGRFIKNSAYSKKESVSRLYEFIIKHYPGFDEDKFTKANCLVYIFPEQKLKLEQLNGDADKFINKRLKNPFYDLKNLVNDFIIEQELTTTSHEKTILLIKGLFKRQMHEKAFQIIDKELKRLEGMVGDDFYHHFYQFQLIELRLTNSLDQFEASDELFSDLHNKLDLFFAHTKIKYGFEAINQNNLLGKKYNLYFWDITKKLIDERVIPNSNLSMFLYSRILKLKDFSTQEDFIKVKQFYFEKFDVLCRNERKSPLISLLNFAMEQYKMGKQAYLNEMLDLYKFGLEKDILLKNGLLSINDFRNIVVISTTLFEFDWAKSFVNSKAHLLPEKYRQNAILINKAQIESSLKNNNTVIELLRDTNFNNVHENLTARSLMMRSYYNLKEFISLNSFLESHYKYVKRNNSISEKEKLPFINMMKFMKILVAENFKKTNKNKLISKLNELQPINCKSWFQNRIDEI